MSDERLIVRATAAFFEDLDRQLPAQRGANGEPSVNDFQVFELLSSRGRGPNCYVIGRHPRAAT